MKKLFWGMCTMVIALLACVSVLAADLTIETKVDVKVKYTEEDLEYSVSLGSGTPITLQDGTVVTVQAGSEADSGIKAVVILVGREDAQAFSYVSGTTKDYGEKPYGFYVLFYRDGKEVKPQAPVTVTVAVPGGYEKAPLYTFTGSSPQAEKLSVSGESGTWTLTVSESRYFAAVLPYPEGTGTEPQPSVSPTPGGNGSSISSGGTTQTNGGTVPGAGSSVQATAARTGDNTHIAGWLFALALSGAAIALTFLLRQKGQEK